MERLIEIGRLFDFYGDLLTERQKSLVRQYAFEDCSLSEIAEREGISRQGVRDAIVHAEEELRQMEQKLHLAQRAQDTVNALHMLRKQLVAENEQGNHLLQIDNILSIWEDDDGI